MANQVKEEIMQMDVDKVSDVAENFSEVSRGILTEKQATAYLLLKVKEMDVEEVADHMGIGTSTVYSHSSVADDKFVAIKLVAEAMDELPWYMYP